MNDDDDDDVNMNLFCKPAFCFVLFLLHLLVWKTIE